jgi:hypothetical protein
VVYACGFQVDALERDAFEVLRLVRSIKNSFAPISRVPPEVLSLIPDYYREEDNKDQDLIALTHVCQGWRDTFISRSSLWTRFDFTNIDKTHTYIERSQSSPLELCFGGDHFIEDAFPLITPHIHRLKSLTVSSENIKTILMHLFCPVPLLEKLDISIPYLGGLDLDATLFNGDFSSLHELYLSAIINDLPQWKNLTNLRTVRLTLFPKRHGITQILDFLESAPLLHTVALRLHMQGSSDAPPERIVPLRHLKSFTILAHPPPPILLHHLHIPTGASLTSEFQFIGEESPLPEYLTKVSLNFSNLSHITAINIFFDEKKTFVRFSGSSGNLRVFTHWQNTVSHTVEYRIFRSLHPILSTIERLAVFKSGDPEPTEFEDRPIFQMLSSTNHLQTLTLTNASLLFFIRALDPEQNPSNLVLCVDLKELVLHVKYWDHVKRACSMAKNRASRGVKLASVTFVDRADRWPRELEMLFELRKHVTHVTYRVDEALPPWDEIPGGSCGEGE